MSGNSPYARLPLSMILSLDCTWCSDGGRLRLALRYRSTIEYIRLPRYWVMVRPVHEAHFMTRCVLIT